MKIYRSIPMLLLAVVALAACEKNAVQLIAGPQAGGANVKFFNFAVGSPAVNFYINDKKTTAVTATGCSVLTDANREQCTTTGSESTSGVAYGSSANGSNGWYSDVTPGQVVIQGRIAAATDKDLPISNLQASVADGKFYSVYLSGAYDATSKTADSFILEDALPATDYTVAYVRFVNASSTSNPVTLYAKDRVTLLEVPVGGEVAYKNGGAFVPIPAASYDLATREAGSATNTISRTSVSFAEGRVYTITARGTTSKALDNTANR